MVSSATENSCVWVSSRGLLRSCDVHAATPASSRAALYDYDWSSIDAAASVYVCSSALPQFARLLDQLPRPVVLVSGDADESVPSEVFASEAAFERFVEHPKLLHWHAQNAERRHPKLSPLPIGLDYHTMAASPSAWGPRMAPRAQEQLLRDIARAAAPLHARLPKAYANFQFAPAARHGADRYRAYDALPASLVDYEPQRVPRAATWRHQSRYAFVVSPHGNGLDCHRTWEALCLGCIPIVRSSPLDDLYTDLPVYIVSDWREVNAAALERVLDDFVTRTFDLERLTLAYWTARFVVSECLSPASRAAPATPGPDSV